MAPRRRVIVGTAGHVDHGKTRLLEALTGIDCDRWAEEKARGITIDLGFAHLTKGDLQIGFIDVPGHERFLHNALAGLGGIRVMLLVVAADQGVEQQTREHLAICSLLDIPYALVALTKVDLVPKDLVELAMLEVDDVLNETPFKGAPILPVSALTGEGMTELQECILEISERAALSGRDSRPVRLPIDRAFLLQGLGSIVTGTLLSGQIESGEELELIPGNRRGRVRSLQVFGEQRHKVSSGERVSLQVTGWEQSELARGGQLATPSTLDSSHSLLGRLVLLEGAEIELTGWTSVRFHLQSFETLGKVRPLDPPQLNPGEEGIVEIRLDRSVATCRTDHFVLRRPSPAATLGGGQILDPRWHRRRGSSRSAAVEAIRGSTETTVPAWVAEAGEIGSDAKSLARRLGISTQEIHKTLEQLVRSGKLLRVEPKSGGSPRWLDPAVVRRVEDRARRVLEEYFHKNRLSESMPKAEALRRILRRGQDLSDTYLEWLTARQVLVVAGDQVGIFGRTTLLTDEESKLSQSILSGFQVAGLKPPSPPELTRKLGAKPQIFDGMLSYLVQQKKLTRLPGGLILATSALEETRQVLESTGWDRFDVPRFKDQFELSRKWAIPILEFFDSQGYTRRLGNERQIIKKR